MGNCLPRAFGLLDEEDDDRRGNGGAVMEDRHSTPSHPQPMSYANQLFDYSAHDQAARTGDSTTPGPDPRVKALLEQMPADLYKDDMKQAECAICMEELAAGDSVRYLPCLHGFHQTCVDDWLQRSFTCPSCLEPVDSTLLSSFTAHTQQSLSALASSPATKGGRVLTKSPPS